MKRPLLFFSHFHPVVFLWEFRGSHAAGTHLAATLAPTSRLFLPLRLSRQASHQDCRSSVAGTGLDRSEAGL